MNNSFELTDEKYRAVVENTPDIIIRFDRDLKILYANSNIRLINNNSDFLDNNIVDSSLDENFIKAAGASIHTVFKYKKIFESEFETDFKNQKKLFNCRIIPEIRKSEDSIPFSALCICRDITHHRELEKNYKMLFDSMLDGFGLHEIVYDSEGMPCNFKFLLVNQAFENLTGLKNDEIIGKFVLDILPDFEKEWIEIYGKVAKTGASERFELYSSSLNKHLEVHAFCPMKNQFACIFQDISLRKNLEAELIISERLAAVGQLSSGIAHEFNNILAIIKGNAQLLKMDIENLSDEQKEMLDIIDEQTNRGKDIANRMMSFSSPRKLSKEKYDIVEIIKEVISIQERRLMMDNIDIEFSIEDCNTDYFLLMDKKQIQQVIVNLLINAAHAIKPKGRGIIKIHLSQTDKNIIIAIEDNGVGMNPDTKSKIFTPFFSTKGAFSNNDLAIKGTGLGLLICLTIVKMHNGSINIESQEGQGSTFIIKLPQAN